VNEKTVNKTYPDPSELCRRKERNHEAKRPVSEKMAAVTCLRDFERKLGAIFPIMDVSLFILLTALDHTAALAMVPYLIYRVYAVFWGYTLCRANQ
jgi:hypothetical protein